MKPNHKTKTRQPSTVHGDGQNGRGRERLKPTLKDIALQLKAVQQRQELGFDLRAVFRDELIKSMRILSNTAENLSLDGMERIARVVAHRRVLDLMGNLLRWIQSVELDCPHERRSAEMLCCCRGKSFRELRNILVRTTDTSRKALVDLGVLPRAVDE